MEDRLFLENKKLNINEIKERKLTLSSKLTSLICSLTNRCNLHCIMCDTWRMPWEMPPEIYKEIRSLFPYLEHVIWLGGEVFFSKYFEEVLEETKKYPHLKQRINTNGLFITQEWAQNLFQNNVELIYSIDGVTKETYEYIRKGARFEDLIKSLNIIKDLKKRHNNKKFSLRMNVVIMKANYREVEKFIDFAKEYEFDLVQLMPIVGEDTPEHIFSSKHKNMEILEYLDSMAGAVQEKARQYNIELFNSLPSLHAVSENTEVAEPYSGNGEPFCYLPWQQLLIYPDGNVRFGCFCIDPIGNVLENSIEEIWNSEKAKEYRKKITENDYQNLCSDRCVQGKISIKLRRVGEADIYL